MLDLDGVLWLAEQPIDGAADAVNRLRAAGVRVVFFTNNSFTTRVQQLEKFERHGIDVDGADLFGSAQAAARLVEPGERAYVLGGWGINEALEERGVEIVDGTDLTTFPGTVDVVVVGLDRKITFDRLTIAARAIRLGARFIATNDDATYPTPDGPLPGGGSIVAAVAVASGASATVAGKPRRVAAELVTSTVGRIDLMVGDRPETDGAFAAALGAPFALVRSGVTAPGAVAGAPTAQFDTADLHSLVEDLL
jgi:4-nitrophenyl phosphatase